MFYIIEKKLKISISVLLYNCGLNIFIV